MFKPGYEEWWVNKKLDKLSAVFDFRYHRDAGWWFDHHETSFSDDADKYDFKKSESNHKGWDPGAPSCAGLVLKHISEKFSFEFPDRLKELIHWVDIIDSASYESVDQAINPSSDGLLLGLSTTQDFDLNFASYIIERLVDNPISEVIKLPEVKSRIDKARRLQQKAIEDVQKSSRVTGNSVFVETDGIFGKFPSYFAYPDILYSVIINKESDFYHISVGVNPWLRSKVKHKDIGIIMKKYGGGGHKTVGATEVKTKKEALDIANKIIEELNNDPV